MLLKFPIRVNENMKLINCLDLSVVWTFIHQQPMNIAYQKGERTCYIGRKDVLVGLGNIWKPKQIWILQYLTGLNDKRNVIIINVVYHKIIYSKKIQQLNSERHIRRNQKSKHKTTHRQDKLRINIHKTK